MDRRCHLVVAMGSTTRMEHATTVQGSMEVSVKSVTSTHASVVRMINTSSTQPVMEHAISSITATTMKHKTAMDCVQRQWATANTT